MKQAPQSNIIKTRPAPTGGLNARDSLAGMPETDAVRLTNWIPDGYGVRCRKGYKEWALGFAGGGAVSSIMPYFAADDGFPGGTYLSDPTTMPGKLFCATDNDIWDISSRTNTPVSAIALSGSTNAGWFSTTMLTNSAGSHMLACSETDGYFTYDGTTWLKRVFGVGIGEVSGVDPANLVHVNVWKRRAWFVERDSTSCWYLPADTLAGVAVEFDFGPLLKKGGHISYTASWTIDAGTGIDDFFVAVSSNGEVLVYKGTDPATANAFELVGVWPVGQIPVGRRAYSQYGGDLVIVSTDGVSPLSAVTRGGSVMLTATNKEYSTKVRPLIGAALRNSFTARGWDVQLHPTERILMVSSPDYSGAFSQQFALSTSVNEWCVFNDIPVLCYGSIGGFTFAGTKDGRVLILFTARLDNVPYSVVSGNAINGRIVSSYSYFDAPALQKQFLMVRPSFLSEVSPNLSVDVNVDFAVADPTGSPTYVTFSSSVWDTALWNTALWGGEKRPFSEWTSVGGLGAAGAISMTTKCVGDTILTAVDYMFRKGGPF